MKTFILILLIFPMSVTFSQVTLNGTFVQKANIELTLQPNSGFTLSKIRNVGDIGYKDAFLYGRYRIEEDTVLLMPEGDEKEQKFSLKIINEFTLSVNFLK